MKKIMLMQIVIAICAVLNIPGASCQTTDAFAKSETRPADTITDTITQDDELVSRGIVRENRNEISIKAVREFIKKFGNKENVAWHKTTGGFVARFVSDSVEL